MIDQTNYFTEIMHNYLYILKTNLQNFRYFISRKEFIFNEYNLRKQRIISKADLTKLAFHFAQQFITFAF